METAGIYSLPPVSTVHKELIGTTDIVHIKKRRPPGRSERVFWHGCLALGVSAAVVFLLVQCALHLSTKHFRSVRALSEKWIEDNGDVEEALLDGDDEDECGHGTGFGSARAHSAGQSSLGRRHGWEALPRGASLPRSFGGGSFSSGLPKGGSLRRASSVLKRATGGLPALKNFFADKKAEQRAKEGSYTRVGDNTPESPSRPRRPAPALSSRSTSSSATRRKLPLAPKLRSPATSAAAASVSAPSPEDPSDIDAWMFPNAGTFAPVSASASEGSIDIAGWMLQPAGTSAPAKEASLTAELWAPTKAMLQAEKRSLQLKESETQLIPAPAKQATQPQTEAAAPATSIKALSLQATLSPHPPQQAWPNPTTAALPGLDSSAPEASTKPSRATIPTAGHMPAQSSSTLPSPATGSSLPASTSVPPPVPPRSRSGQTGGQAAGPSQALAALSLESATAGESTLQRTARSVVFPQAGAPEVSASALSATHTLPKY